MPGDREITPEDALLLAAFDQWLDWSSMGR